MTNATSGSEREAWDRHWQTLQGGSLFGALASLVRRIVLRRAVRGYAERFFAASGCFLEAGCGTAESSAALRVGERRLIGLDFSLPVLAQARGSVHRHLASGDLRRLPFGDGALAGIWNLGVMEHFTPAEGHEILCELARVLRPGGCAILFWPPSFGASRWVLGPIERLRSRLAGRPFQFFPDEVNRLRSRRQAREALAAAGLEPAAVEFSLRDGFIHIVAVGRKPAG